MEDDEAFKKFRGHFDFKVIMGGCCLVHLVGEREREREGLRLRANDASDEERVCVCAYVIEGDKERVQVGKENVCASERGERESTRVQVCFQKFASESVCACERE